MKTPHLLSRSGFALPTVLVLSAGLLILLGALMTIVTLERRTAQVSGEIFRAELAVESGLEEAKAILAAVGSSDSFVIAEQAMAVAYDDDGDGDVSSEEDGTLDEDAGERGRSYLYGIQGSVAGGGSSYRLTPLFTAGESPDTVTPIDGSISMPEEPGLSEESESGLEALTAIRGNRAKQPPVTNWRVIRNQDGDAIAQYSFWVEDMQGYLDPTLAPGNETGRENSQWPQVSNWSSLFQSRLTDYQANMGEVPLWPAPGLNPAYTVSSSASTSTNSLLNQVSLFVLGTEGEEDIGDLPPGSLDDTEFDERVREVADLAPTSSSLSLLYGVGGDGEREATGVDRGRLIDEEARQLEENLTRGNRSWREQAIVPFAPGLDPSVMGGTQLNLNALLAQPRVDAVDEMASFISAALPDFASEREGGFTEDYLATLAANALDYADEDSVPSVEEGVYRGVENTPLVSEFLRTTTYAWENVDDMVADSFSNGILNETSNPFIRRDGRLLLAMTVRIYAEFWNQTNHTAEGSYRFSYENYRSLAEGFMPETSFADEDLLSNNLAEGGSLSSGLSGSYHELEKDDDDGLWYFPARELTLEPNGYLLEMVGSVRYLFDVGTDSYFASNSIDLLDGVEQSSFRMKWDGGTGEFALADWARGGVEISELSNIDVDRGDSRTFSHVCANSYRELFGDFANGMGDLRMNYYAEIPLTDSRYPDNYSPGRRNIRYGTIYSQDEDTIYGRTLPSEWPDGGHDSTADWSSFSRSTDPSIMPDAPQFLERATVEPEKAPVFISNLGRFVSESELGRVFDPQMWEKSSGSTSEWLSETTNSAKTSDKVGGGNTLRIGRPEHERFYRVSSSGARGDSSTSALRLLDLFHAGLSLSEDDGELQGEMREVSGHVNINTAPYDVLRALAAGKLVNDPELATESSRHDTNNDLAPRTSSREASAPSETEEADLVADAIIAGRPYLSASELAIASVYLDSSRSEEVLLGNPDFMDKGSSLQWSDPAAEEVFGRVYNSSTVRSRNFRVHVVGQSLRKTPSGRYLVGSTKKKSYRVFVDRGSDTGEIVPEEVSVEVIHEVNQ